MIETETLSIKSIPGLLQLAITQLQNEYEQGMLKADDGDMVTWSITKDAVTF